MGSRSTQRPLRLFYSYSHQDERLRARLETHLEALRRLGSITGWHERKISPGSEWQQQIHQHLESADLILLLISADFIASRYCYDVEMNRALERHENGEARVIPVILRPSDWAHSRFGALQALPPNGKPVTSWRNRDEALTAVTQGLRTVAEELRQKSCSASNLAQSAVLPGKQNPTEAQEVRVSPAFLETGAMPIDSPFFVSRPALGAASRQLLSPQPTVTLKGYRQSGKSTILVRLHHQARGWGWKSCYLNFQNLDAVSFHSSRQLFLELARMLSDELHIDADPDDHFSSQRGAKANLTRFLEGAVLAPEAPTLLLFDEVDLAFGRQGCQQDLFSMLRSWHNKRSEDTSRRWTRLALVIAHATDVALWIPDIHQSPFNVGLRLVMEDFGVDEVAELDRRHGTPLGAHGQIAELMEWVGGHPFLVRLALYALVRDGWSFADLEAAATTEGGPFASYLRRVLLPLLEQDELVAALRQVLAAGGCDDEGAFQRLWSAGVLQGDTREEATLRCRLYREYLGSRL